MLSKKQSFLLVFISVLMYLSIVFYNGFPLFTPDSGAYVDFAFNNRYPEERPVFYSLFIHTFSLGQSLFLVVFFQSLILIVLMHLLINQFFKITFFQQLLIHSLTILLTSSTWFVAQIMPDIFTPILGFAMILFLNNKKTALFFFYIPVIIFSIVCHNSNLLSGSILFFIILIFRQKWLISLKRSFYFGSIVLLSWLIVCYTNFHAGYGFTPNKMSHVFLMGKFSESGVLKTYLKDQCHLKEYKICEFKEELPNHAWDFVWASDGPFVKTGGWSQDPQEYKSIINATFTHPKYLSLHVFESIKATFYQIKLPYIGDGLSSFDKNSSVHSHIANNFPKSTQLFEKSKQNQAQLNFNFLNEIYKYSIPILFFLCVFALYKKPQKNHLIIFSFLCCCILINAFTTASFANILSRLNSRMLWVLPFICLTIFIDYLNSKSIKTILKTSN